MISDKQLANVKAIIEASEKAGVTVIYVRHNDSASISKFMVEWWNGDKIDHSSEGWKIIDDLDTTGKIIIDKNQYAAFFKTELDEILRANNIEDVIIVGVMTNCYCETTAREAFMYGYRVFFINDATATINEALHVAALKKHIIWICACPDATQIVSNLNLNME